MQKQEINVDKLGGKFFKPDIIKSFVELQISPRYKNNNRTLYVVSALEGITRILVKILETKDSLNLSKDIKESIITRLLENFAYTHIHLMEKLFGKDHSVYDDFYQIFSELEKYAKEDLSKSLPGDTLYATILQFGELTSAKIFSEYLSFKRISNKLLDARKYLLTTDTPRNASVEMVHTSFQNFFQTNTVLITHGFIGRSASGTNTVLGFDGSDTSASEFALSFDESLFNVTSTFWKDVLGVYNKHPSNPDALLLRNITGDDFARLLPSSVPVRHDAIAKLMAKQRVAIVRSFIDFENEGTRITCAL